MHQNEYEVKYRWMMRVQNTPRECVTPVGAASCARTRRCAPRRSASSTARSAASEACARQRRTPGEPGLFRVAASACKPWQPCANRSGNRRERWQTVQTVMKKEGMCLLNLPLQFARFARFANTRCGLQDGLHGLPRCQKMCLHVAYSHEQQLHSEGPKGPETTSFRKACPVKIYLGSGCSAGIRNILTGHSLATISIYFSDSLSNRACADSRAWHVNR